MQKLLRRTPSASGPLILSVNKPLCLSFCNTTSSVSLLGFSNGRDIPKMSSSIAALRFSQQPIVPVSTTAAARNFRLKRIQPSSCRPCTCSLENDTNTAPLRAWAVRKDIHGFGRDGVLAGSQGRAWFTTIAAKDRDELENEIDAEIAKVRLQRRNRSSGGGGGGGGVVVSCPDLRTIPGVGPRNLRKLVDKGFEGVAQLKKLYKDKFYGESSPKMVEYLQSSVGIIHKNHAESITTYIKESVDEEQKENCLKQAQKKRITLCVEGNISVGKTTFLQKIANETLELRDLVEIVPEPIDKWQNIGSNHFNILDAFYAEPERYAYTFQNYVFVTRVMQERESSAGIKPLRLMERSVFSDRMVFVRAVHEAKWMNEMEISIYDSWFDPVVSSLPGLIPDGFIYLRASPDTCHKRMMLRKREEEGGVSLDYLRGLHEKHESWLLPFESGNHGVLSVSKMANETDWSLHPNIKDRVFYLDGDHMHSSIKKVPALVLDCEPDIDFRRDIEAKREYARQVAEFFEFVKKKKDIPPSNGTTMGSQPQVLLPNNQNLWMPFPSSALNESFKQAFSPVPQ